MSARSWEMRHRSVSCDNPCSLQKEAGDEHHLIQDISFAHAMHLSLSDHVYHFKALQGSPRGLERKETHPELDQPFHGAVILLDDIVEVFPLTQFAEGWHDLFRFQFFESFGIGRVFINCNDSRRAGMGRSKRFLESA